MFLPIIKFNGGRWTMLCNKCSCIVKENLSKAEIIESRTSLLFCDKHNKEYLAATEEPAWVCLECANERGASMPRGHCFTLHIDVCGICEHEANCTEPRDFGITRNRLRVEK